MASMAAQRIICAQTVLPLRELSSLALNEHDLGLHLEKFLMAEDNKDRTFVFSAPPGGCHVYCFAPSKKLQRRFWTCVTMGMSGTKMNVPADIENGELFAHAEVLCYLPENWDFPRSLSGPPDKSSWPLEMLRSLAQYVNSTAAWIGVMHGLPSLLGDPPGQVFCEETKLSHMLLLDPGLDDELMSSVEVRAVDGQMTNVNFYMVVPITAQEAAWKRESGFANSLAYIIGNKSQEAHTGDVIVDYIIDPGRPCAVGDLSCRDAIEGINLEEGEIDAAAADEDDDDGSVQCCYIRNDDDGFVELAEDWEDASRKRAAAGDEEGIKRPKP